MDPEDYKEFCGSRSTYVYCFNRWLDNIKVNPEEKEKALNAIAPLIKFPDYRTIYDPVWKYIEKVDGINDNIEKTLVGIGTVAGFGAAAIFGGELANKYLENYPALNYLATGVSAIAGMVAGVAGGFGTSSISSGYFQKKKSQKEKIANETLIQEVNKYLESSNKNNSI
jgi:hypothetical protein